MIVMAPSAGEMESEWALGAASDYNSAIAGTPKQQEGNQAEQMG